MSIHRWSPSWSGKPSGAAVNFVMFEHYCIRPRSFSFVNFQAAKREIDLNVLLCLWSPWWLSFNIYSLETTQLLSLLKRNSLNVNRFCIFLGHFSSFSTFPFLCDELLRDDWFCFVVSQMLSDALMRRLRTGLSTRHCWLSYPQYWCFNSV